jgi:glyoxylase-like metal-dependent hydrolase (beta-lactamase superfamily II)/ketosteroid isomerase-like protein
MPSGTTEDVAKRYFAAVTARDVDGMVACWKPGGRENIRGQMDGRAPDDVRAFFENLFSAVPDFHFEVVSITAEDERAAVRWTAHGTFVNGTVGGYAAHGGPISLEGIDELTVRDGLIVENNAFPDNIAFARQLGVLPPEGSRAEAGMTKLFNAKTRMSRKLGISGIEPVADGVWLIRGGMPAKDMNVYFVKDGDGVLLFDAGIRQMTNGVAAAALELGGLTRVVLGHSHADHRGVAPALGVPVYCHEAEKADAESDGGAHYFDMSQLPTRGRVVFKRLLPYWDGGPVQIAGTLKEGDEVAGFEVVHLPGHAPGLIALWRESDRLALATDCFYTLDPLSGRKGKPRVPHTAFNQDTQEARRSIRKLAALRPSAAWPGHADPLTGDVAAQLEEAAATT